MADRRREAITGALLAWLQPRRWFPARLAGAELTVVERLELPDPEDEARVEVLVLGAVGEEADPPYVQVPLVHREPGTSQGVPIAEVEGLALVDGPSDPAFLRAWLAATPQGPRVAPGLDLGAARLVSGEQSNSSVVVPGSEGGAILKVFRSLWPGRNPDVDVPAALAAAGWPHVPAPLAWLEHGAAPFHLGVLSRFVPGAEDGFELACAHAARSESLAAEAAQLGTVVAEMHATLAHVLPVERRVTAAELTSHLHARLADLDHLPHLQRVHGDLHLGQLLRGPERWYVLDFEGEPMVPLTERTLPGLALRDVAGVLRSFDYAAARGGAGEDWTHAARTAFLGAYRDRVPEAASRQAALVLRAFEADKALYEVVYETQNRPAWAEIPLRALQRLLGTPLGGRSGGRV